jgi:hypothetical protein
MRVMPWDLKDKIFTLDDPKRVAESLNATAERDAHSDRAELATRRLATVRRIAAVLGSRGTTSKTPDATARC